MKLWEVIYVHVIFVTSKVDIVFLLPLIHTSGILAIIFFVRKKKEFWNQESLFFHSIFLMSLNSFIVPYFFFIIIIIVIFPGSIARWFIWSAELVKCYVWFYILGKKNFLFKFSIITIFLIIYFRQQLIIINFVY